MDVWVPGQLVACTKMLVFIVVPGCDCGMASFWPVFQVLGGGELCSPHFPAVWDRISCRFRFSAQLPYVLPFRQKLTAYLFSCPRESGKSAFSRIFTFSRVFTYFFPAHFCYFPLFNMNWGFSPTEMWFTMQKWAFKIAINSKMFSLQQYYIFFTAEKIWISIIKSPFFT